MILKFKHIGLIISLSDIIQEAFNKSVRVGKKSPIFGPKIMRYNMSSFSNEQIKKAVDL